MCIQEKGIYGVDDDCDQHKAQYYNTGCQAKANAQAVSTLNKISDADPPGNPISITVYHTVLGFFLMCLIIMLHSGCREYADQVWQ